MSFRHLEAAIWHRWTIICGVLRRQVRDNWSFKGQYSWSIFKKKSIWRTLYKRISLACFLKIVATVNVSREQKNAKPLKCMIDISLQINVAHTPHHTTTTTTK